MRSMVRWILIAAAGLIIGETRGAQALPSTDQLFGCPLSASASDFIPPASWTSQTLDRMNVSLVLPPDWKVQGKEPVVQASSSDGQTIVTVRKQNLSGLAGLSLARSLVEFTELGPSHMGVACGLSLARQVDGLSRWRAVQVSAYGRPLGERRRSFALYAHQGTEIFTVVVTTRWSREDDGPDLPLVRRLLGALQPYDPSREMALLGP